MVSLLRFTVVVNTSRPIGGRRQSSDRTLAFFSSLGSQACSSLILVVVFNATYTACSLMTTVSSLVRGRPIGGLLLSLLHLACASRRFVNASVPPHTRGIIWSIVGGSVSSGIGSWQIQQLLPSRFRSARTFLRRSLLFVLVVFRFLSLRPILDSVSVL